MHERHRWLLWIRVIAGIALAMTWSALVAPKPVNAQGDEGFSANTATGTCDGDVTIAGDGFEPGVILELIGIFDRVVSTDLGHATVDSSGSFVESLGPILPTGCVPGLQFLFVARSGDEAWQAILTIPSVYELVIEPAATDCSTTVSIDGAGFPSGRVELWVGNADATVEDDLLELTTVTPSAAGEFRVEVDLSSYCRNREALSILAWPQSGGQFTARGFARAVLRVEQQPEREISTPTPVSSPIVEESSWGSANSPSPLVDDSPVSGTEQNGISWIETVALSTALAVLVVVAILLRKKRSKS